MHQMEIKQIVSENLVTVSVNPIPEQIEQAKQVTTDNLMLVN